MGRNREPIEDPGPVGRFAQHLRDRMDTAVPRPTFRRMGVIATYSYTTLSEAAAGKKFPTWYATRAFLIGCGADESEIDGWRQHWEGVRATIGNPSRVPGDRSIAPPRPSSDGRSNRLGRLRLVQPDQEVGRGQPRPRPENVRTFGDLRDQLDRMKGAIGNPDVHTLSQRLAGYSPAALSEVFAGNRYPGLDATLRLVNAMLDEADEGGALDASDHDVWTSIDVWRAAWNRAELDARRTQRTRTPQYDNVVDLTDNHNEGGSAAQIIAEMNDPQAAAILAGLAPGLAGAILGRLPIGKAQAILTAIEESAGGPERKVWP